MSMARIGIAGGLALAMIFAIGCGSTSRAKERDVTIHVGEDLRGYEVSVAMIGISDSDVAHLDSGAERAEFFSDLRDGTQSTVLGEAWVREFSVGTGERSATLSNGEAPWPAWIAGTKNGGVLTKVAVLARIGANGWPEPVFLPLIDETKDYSAVAFEVTDRFGIRRVVAR